MLDPRRHLELLTPREMAQADAFAIAAGTPGIDLMERAGAAVAEETARRVRSRGRIVIACGPGGNGGDGLIAARLLTAWGYPVAVGLLGSPKALRGDAALALARFGGPVETVAALNFEAADGVIDALFGAGLARDLDGEALAAVARINAASRAGVPVVAVDVPSGVDGETGAIRGAAVEASASVTFFRLKPGHLLLPGMARCGDLRLAEIGIPKAALRGIETRAFVNAPGLWRHALPHLKPDDHKYSRGAALVLSGPQGRTGAARMAARAALRAGAGLVTLASPRDALAEIAAQVTAVMVSPFEGRLGFEALLADPRRTAILLGPGAGAGSGTRQLVAAALTTPAPRRGVVLDADALTSFSDASADLARYIAVCGHAAVLTPHAGEFARLFGNDAEVVERLNKIERTRAAARRVGAVVVLKGADTVVAAPDGRAAVGFDLPNSLATAGSGDILAGIVTGLLAAGAPPFEAAAAAVWLHGACARELGAGLIAEDLIEALPKTLRQLEGREIAALPRID